MAYDWTKDDSGEAPRLAVGQEHDIEITKVIYGNKSGPFRTKADPRTGESDPRIMLVMADADGGGCAQMVTLSHKAAWVLKSILGAAGANLQKMTEKGIEPQDFADEEFGNAQLIGRKLRIRVKSYVSPDGNLAEVVAIRSKPTASPEANEIPF